MHDDEPRLPRLEAATTIARYPPALDQPTITGTWEPPVGEDAIDESMLEWVKAELESGAPHAPTWDKAVAEANGDEAAAEAAYYRLRIASLFS